MTFSPSHLYGDFWYILTNGHGTSISHCHCYELKMTRKNRPAPSSRYLKVLGNTIYVVIMPIVLYGAFLSHRDLQASRIPTVAKSYYTEAISAANKKQFNRSLDLFGKAISMAPGFREALFQRSRVYYNAFGMVDTALEDLATVLDITPQFHRAHYLRGKIYSDQRRYDKAVIEFTVAISLSPRFADAYKDKGHILITEGLYREAIKEYSSAIKIMPNDPDFYYHRGVCYRKTGKLGNALKDIGCVLALVPESHEAYYEKGMALFGLRQLTDAEKAFSSAIDLNPGYHPAYVNRGNVLAKLQQYESAFVDFNHSIRLAPWDANSYLSRGAVYMHHFKQVEKACIDWKHACELGDCRGHYRALSKKYCE